MDSNEEEAESAGQWVVPEGTYTQTWSDAGGNCSNEAVNEITSGRSDIELEEPKECAQLVYEDTETLDNGCQVELSMSIEASDDGLEDGEATMEVSCSASECSHDFNIYHQKR